MSRKKFFIISLCVIIPIVAAVVVICIYPYISKKNEPTNGQITPRAPDNILWEPTLLTSQTQIVNDEISFAKPVYPEYGLDYLCYIFKISGNSGKLQVGPYATKDYLFAFKESVSLLTVVENPDPTFMSKYSVEMIVTTCDSLGQNKHENSIDVNKTSEWFVGNLNAENTSWNYVYSVLTTFKYV